MAPALDVSTLKQSQPAHERSFGYNLWLQSQKRFAISSVLMLYR